MNRCANARRYYVLKSTDNITGLRQHRPILFLRDNHKVTGIIKVRDTTEVETKYTSHNWLCEKAILATTNDTLDNVNRVLLKRFQGKSMSIYQMSQLMISVRLYTFQQVFFKFFTATRNSIT